MSIPEISSKDSTLKVSRAILMLSKEVSAIILCDIG